MREDWKSFWTALKVEQVRYTTLPRLDHGMDERKSSKMFLRTHSF